MATFASVLTPSLAPEISLRYGGSRSAISRARRAFARPKCTGESAWPVASDERFDDDELPDSLFDAVGKSASATIDAIEQV